MILEHVANTAIKQINASISQLENLQKRYQDAPAEFDDRPDISASLIDLQSVVKEIEDYKSNGYDSQAFTTTSEQRKEIVDTDLDRIEAYEHRNGNDDINVHNPVWRAFRRVYAMQNNTVLEMLDDLKEGVPIIGDGSGALYLYYYSGSRETAELERNRTWDCYLAYTDDGDAFVDLLDNDFNYDAPYFPTVAFVLKYNNPEHFWDTIRYTLAHRFRSISAKDRVVCLDTTPDDVKEIEGSVMFGEYQYAFEGKELTAKIGEILIMRLFLGQEVHEDVIIEKVAKFHVANGGLLPTEKTALGSLGSTGQMT